MQKIELRRFSFLYSPARGTDSQFKAHSYARRQQHLNAFFSSRDRSPRASLPATLSWSLAYVVADTYVQIHLFPHGSMYTAFQDGVLLVC